jgi:hypothetical protein
MAWDLWIINCLNNVHKVKICESQTFLWVTIAKVDVCSPDRTMHGLVRSWPGENPEQFYFCLWLTKDFVIHKLWVHVVVVIHKKNCYSQIVRSSDSDPRLQRTESPLKTRREAIQAKNSENIEIRKTNLISSSTQPKEEFPCALCWDSLKLRGSRIFT